jgi:hypothetical protein
VSYGGRVGLDKFKLVGHVVVPGNRAAGQVFFVFHFFGSFVVQVQPAACCRVCLSVISVQKLFSLFQNFSPSYRSRLTRFPFTK